ncbi:MAG: protein phosphatase 2C domain-containing protein [Longimonas sp.]|uniref:protein phosphatase 2C domain-containing protein n=1 Tax=Longimonas sp. TaxID=2039626 RepID=UPI00335CCE6D
MLPISAHGTTYPGRREVNQDDILQLYPHPDAFFLAVADGMGGTAGGQIASQSVLERIQTYLEERFQYQTAPEDLKEILSDVYEEAQEAIRSVIDEEPSLQGMGTTLTCVLGFQDRFVVGNMGDSRVYYLHKGQMRQVTTDHSYLEEFRKQANTDELDPKFVRQYGHIINKTLDGGNDSPDFFPTESPYFELSEGDGFLLCSDGLIVDKMDNQEQMFASYMIGTENLQTAAESLVSLAYHAGSTDNISVVMAEAGTISRNLGRVRTYAFPPAEEMA